MAESIEVEYRRPWLYPKQRDALFHGARYGLIEASTKVGKAQPLDALIYTPKGPVEMGSVEIGQEVLTPFGGRSKIIGIYPQGERDVYRVTFVDGAEVEADGDHWWEIHEFRKSTPTLYTTREIMAWTEGRRNRAWVLAIKPVDYEPNPVSFDPYALGLLIGDGGLKRSIVFSSQDEELIQALKAALPPGHTLRKESGDNVDWVVTTGSKGAHHRERGTHIFGLFRRLGLFGKGSHEKHIPTEYKYNSEEVRWAILQGILDTDGFVDKHGQPAIEQTSPQLAADITELVESLGGSTLTKLRLVNGYKDITGAFIKCRPVYRQTIKIPDATKCFRLRRKKDRATAKIKTGNRMFRSIEFTRRAPVQCIEIDHPRHLYLTNGLIPTHNTVGCIAWLLEHALKGKAGWNYWWIAPIRAQAEIAYKRLKRGIPASLFRKNDSDLTVTLANGATIWFKGSDNPDSLYGEDVYAAVIDECSRVKEPAFWAVRSTLTATQGPIRLIGNVKGRRNWFYGLCRRAEVGESDMHYAKLIAADAVAAGVLSAAEIEDARSKLPLAVFEELYLAKPSDDGGNPFGIKAIDEACSPFSNADPAVWGVDLAKSVDWTWPIGLDEDGCICVSERWQGPWRMTKERLANLIGGTPALIDSTGVGDPIVEDLQTVCPSVEGFKFTSQSKQQIMEGLAADLQQGRVHGVDSTLRLELESYEYEYTRLGVRYTCPEGMTDDGVCALALGRQMQRAGTGGMLQAFGRG